MAKLKVSVVTPLRQVVRAEVDEVSAPSVLGEVGIRPGHTPILADLNPGPVVLHVGNEVDPYAVSGGFIEVGNDQVTILAETAEQAREIDVARAEAALKDAQEKLKSLGPMDDDYEEEHHRLKRAQTRINVAKYAAH